MNRSYQHLNQVEREALNRMIRMNWSIRRVAQALGRSPSTITRELARNRPHTLYDPLKAHGLARKRRYLAHRRPLRIRGSLRRRIVRLLRKRWSPEIISAVLALDPRSSVLISPRCIYDWVYHHATTLTTFLPRHHRRRYPQQATLFKRSIPGRIPLSERPLCASTRHEMGHWESDLVVGSGRAALKVTVERKSLFTRVLKVPDKSAQASFQALRRFLAKLPQPLRRSVTYDNGSENFLHAELNAILPGLRSYFCQPHCAWEKPIVENTNGLIRRFFPKSTNFDNISPRAIAQVQRWINSRPRKTLNFKTSAEIFREATVALTT